MASHPLRTRTDTSEHLIHFMRQPSVEHAFSVLGQIVLERQLLGGTGYIKGGHRCVCFTEAPLDSIREVFWRSRGADLRFKPFGVVVTKDWLFERGGRPVIYQPDSDYSLLPPELRYRHVRYEPNAQPPIDLTWEREWRVKTDSLTLNPQNCDIVVLEKEHAERLRHAFDAQQQAEVERIAISVGLVQAEQYREAFPWRVITLGEIDPAEVAELYADQGFLDR
jgi:hypothetical protein